MLFYRGMTFHFLEWQRLNYRKIMENSGIQFLVVKLLLVFASTIDFLKHLRKLPKLLSENFSKHCMTRWEMLFSKWITNKG